MSSNNNIIIIAQGLKQITINGYRLSAVLKVETDIMQLKTFDKADTMIYQPRRSDNYRYQKSTIVLLNDLSSIIYRNVNVKRVAIGS